MVAPDKMLIPFPVHAGWPERAPDHQVTVSEAGILLGGLQFSDDQWSLLASTSILTVRLDDHPNAEWLPKRNRFRLPRISRSVIPTSPVTVPPSALADRFAFSDWVCDTHGAGGRLMLWDGSVSWWAVNDADLEATIVCAPEGHPLLDTETLDSGEEIGVPFEWLTGMWTDELEASAASAIERYGLTG